MEKIKVQGAYLNLQQTAKLFGMSQEEVESVRRIANEVRMAKGREAIPSLGRAKRAPAKSRKAA